MNINDWQILKTGKRRDFAIIIAITLIFLLVIAMNVHLIFSITSKQAEEIGQMQLEVIRSDLQGIISTAENTTTQLALESEKLLQSDTTQTALKDFFYKKTNEQKILTNGVCFNVYIAGKDWAIIPNFNMPPEYHANERLWYKGADENLGKLYITEPYVDAMTDKMCFTMSKMLPDKETVVALDFTFSDVQRSILQMSSNDDREALIVTKNGTIIGYTDMSLVGQKIADKLPEYENILERAVQNDNRESFTAKLDDGEHTIFSNKTANGWYMILSVNNRVFYRESYKQIFFTILLSLVMMSAIIFFYLNAMKNGLRAETALRVREEFLSRLSHELRAPLKKILDASSAEILTTDLNPADKTAEVRESALKLSGMLDNLFSFSTIVAENKMSATKIPRNHDLSEVSRYAKQRIIAVLVIAMTVAFVICLTTTISWGNTKMNREVDTYEHQLSTWIEDQRAIVLLFANLLSEHPELMNDYPSAVKFLDDIAKHYPEISVCYLANPYKEHQLIMNNGWESSDPNWKVNKRPWYIETESSMSGFNISSPYLDDQTGLYCVTMSKIVFGKNNEFVGIFAIDFYIDSLTHILGASYSKNGYAFLVDKNGVIINHPNADYQMSASLMTNITNTEYAKVFAGTEVETLTDFRENAVACLAKKNTTSQFTVIVANSWWNIYGNVVALAVMFALLLGVCVSIVHALINRLLRWQASVNRQLKDASDTALAASQAKSQFLAQMSHEIRTPINAVLGMNEMILRESSNPAIIDYAINIQSAGKTLLTLINSILDFSKIEDGKMEILPVRYETITLIDDLVNMISDKLTKKNLEFKSEIDPALPKSLYGDDVRIRQIIINLLSNAVKYTHKGSVTLQIGGSAHDADTFELQVAVRDTGIGIRTEDIGKLFRSFQRLDEERNRNIEGTGLGIAIVQKLLNMMGSKLEVTSVYGQGSNFSFKLIQKIINKNPVGNYAERQMKHADKSTRKKFLVAQAAKVLVVDDNDMNLKVISGLLKKNKIAPDLAESGKQCLELAAKNFYHIIFLDNMMPGMSGIETFHVLRQKKILTPETAVVMLTASAIAGMREAYLREGFDDYLSKPIDVADLESILERHLPANLVSFELDEQKISSTKQIVNKTIEPPDVPAVAPPPPIATVDSTNTTTDIDYFNANERKIFADTCPDINLDVALKYCMDSKSFFVQMLTTFADAKRAEKIQDALDTVDIKNYQILVHALKSTALSIGAENLSECAKTLELAAKNENFAEIQAGHPNLMSAYKKVREQIAKYLSEAVK